MRRGLLAACLALVLAPAADAATTATGPVYDSNGNLIQTPYAPVPPPKRLTEARAVVLLMRDPKVADWLDRYPKRGRSVQGTFDEKRRDWHVRIWWGDAGQIADGRVDDASGTVTEAWTGPQVAWKMARGYEGAFGGRQINRAALWLALCAVFLLGLADWRRPLSWRNLDLLALLSFTVSLWFFNKGDIFTSAPLAYPPLLYVIARTVWIGVRGRNGPSPPSVWPAWILVGATVFLAGFRIGLNVQSSNVIDVGYSGVIGADRIAQGQSPYGHFPVEENLKPCGPADAEGEIRDRIQTNGRCESANPQGDTYGPVSYEAYLPGYFIRGWSGKWDKLPAVHLTSIVFDMLALIGCALVGYRFGGPALGAALPFAWASYPFTQYVSNSNTNDAILPALLLFGLWLCASPWARGIFCALAGWTKFAALLLAPLWLSYPGPIARPGRKLAFAAGFAVATAAAFSILLLEPNPVHAAGVFWDRTLGWQLGRESPFSIWGWGQYHARGIPDLHLVQLVLEVLLVVGALVVAFVPARKTPLQLGALTAALLAGFQLVLTHWFYLYIPWFFPFAAFAVLAPALSAAAAPEERDREAGDLRAAA
jgi:hypothetical protein